MIPDWLREKLASPPVAGAGIHAWLFSTARHLHAHMPAAAVAAALQAATAASGRRVTEREIRDAVNNSREVAWTRKASEVSGGARDSSRPGRGASAVPAADSGRWPRPDPVFRRCRVADAAAAGVASVADLWERSPLAVPDEWTPGDWLDALLPDAEWLCLATDHPGTARSRRRGKWSFGPADRCGLVVPSPMTGPSGTGLDGRLSHRCLGNTGSRRWLVIEFDKEEDGRTNIPVDQQAALHWHLSAAASAMGWPVLRLAVSSGGKSLHGWYGPVMDETSAHDLMAYAVSLGADPATWNRCQLIRLPGGLRRQRAVSTAELPDGWPAPPEVRQQVYFFNPPSGANLSACTPMNNNFSGPSGLSGSTLPPALVTTG